MWSSAGRCPLVGSKSTQPIAGTHTEHQAWDASSGRPVARRLDVAAHVPGGQPEHPQRADREVGEVLAHAAPRRQHRGERRRHLRERRVVLELIVDDRAQRPRRFDHGTAAVRTPGWRGQRARPDHRHRRRSGTPPANGRTSRAAAPRSSVTPAATSSHAGPSPSSIRGRTATSDVAATVSVSCCRWMPNWSTWLPNTSLRRDRSSGSGSTTTSTCSTRCSGVPRGVTTASE